MFGHRAPLLSQLQWGAHENADTCAHLSACVEGGREGVHEGGSTGEREGVQEEGVQ